MEMNGCVRVSVCSLDARNSRIMRTFLDAADCRH